MTLPADVTAKVEDYLGKAQAMSLDQDSLPGLLQVFGMRHFEQTLSLWEIEPDAGFYRFEVRLGGEATDPLVTTWTYRPV